MKQTNFYLKHEIVSERKEKKNVSGYDDKSFLSTHRSFTKTVQSSYPVENLCAPACVKRNSTEHIVSGIL